MAEDVTEPTRLDRHIHLLVTAIGIAGNAAFRRLSPRLRWPSRFSWRGLAAFVAFNTLAHLAVHIWVVPALRRMAAERERARG